MPVPSYAQHAAATAESQPRASAANEPVDGAQAARKPNAQNKHQIEVKLSKVDPYRSAFPSSGIPDNGGCFELFGYDIIVDDSLKPWLLEVNASPSLSIECDADRAVKEPLLADLVELLALQV